MDILSILIIFFFVATIIKIATDNVAQVFKAFNDISKYKLIIALFLTLVGVFGLNRGILEALGIPIEISRWWFHYYDLLVTALFLTGGSQAIHRLAEAWKEYNKEKGGNA